MDLFQQKRLAAVEQLWSSVLALRESLRGPVFFFGTLLPTEYDDVARDKGSAIGASISSLSDETILAGIKPASDVETLRPCVGETLWLQFYVYRAFRGRLAHLCVEGQRRGHIRDWREDSGVKQLLGHVLPAETVTQLLDPKCSPDSIYRAVNSLEALILREISVIMSGQRSSLESFDNAAQLREALASAKPAGV
jgi:hypothetical protein